MCGPGVSQVILSTTQSIRVAVFRADGSRRKIPRLNVPSALRSPSRPLPLSCPACPPICLQQYAFAYRPTSSFPSSPYQPVFCTICVEYFTNVGVRAFHILSPTSLPTAAAHRLCALRPYGSKHNCLCLGNTPTHPHINRPKCVFARLPA